jgi:hypothetical protein
MVHAHLPCCADQHTDSLIVQDSAGEIWDVQYYLGDQPTLFRVGDTVTVAFRTTVARDGRPRRSMIISRAGEVIVYQAEAQTLAELPPAPVSLAAGAPVGTEVAGCVTVERLALAATADGVTAEIPPGRQARVGRYQVVHAQGRREVMRGAGCLSEFLDRFDVGILRLP